MLESIRQNWRAFRHDSPGQRFARRYEKRRRARRGRHFTGLLFAAAGLLLAVAGLFFMAVPGPGIPIFLAGAALVAGESLHVARLLDRFELWVRRQWRRRKSSS